MAANRSGPGPTRSAASDATRPTGATSTSRTTLRALTPSATAPKVIAAIEREAKVLADKTQPREKRVEAMKFVVHLVGDLHQPLHCAERNGDKGGNGRLVFFLDRRKADSLHYVWDTALVREIIGRRAIAPAAEAMSKSISAKQRKEWATGTPEQWANESHRAAVEKVYAGVAADGDPPKLGREYVAKSPPVVTEQIKRASARLARALNECLASAESPTSRPAAAAATRPATGPR